MKKVSLYIIVCALSISLFGQDRSDLNKSSPMDAMRHWEGTWVRSGWALNQAREIITATIIEEVNYKLDGNVIIFEGKGFSEDDWL